jgi:hypothetical protein
MCHQILENCLHLHWIIHASDLTLECVQVVRLQDLPCSSTAMVQQLLLLASHRLWLGLSRVQVVTIESKTALNEEVSQVFIWVD